jgi:hypothetical protein
MPSLNYKDMKKVVVSICIIIILFGCDKAGMNDSAVVYQGGQGGSMARFAVVGNYLYTVDKETLKVFNITNPAEPVYKGDVPVGFGIETIYPFKDKLFIGSTSSVHIFIIDDPAHPRKLSEAISADVIRRCDPVVAKDMVAYATLRSNGPCGGTGSILAVYDIQNITRPVQKAAIPISEPYGLGYSGNTLYVCDRQRGLVLYDITSAYNPVFIKNLTDGEYIDVIPYDNVLICWVSAGMILYDITDAADPVRLTTIN